MSLLVRPSSFRRRVPVQKFVDSRAGNSLGSAMAVRVWVTCLMVFRKKKLPRSPRAVLNSIRFEGINQVSRLIEALRKHRFRGVFPFLAGPPFVFCSLLLMS